MHRKIYAVLLTVCLVLTGCGSEKVEDEKEKKPADPGTNEEQETEEQTENPEQEALYGDRLLEDHFLEGEFKDGDTDTVWKYSCHIPTIQADTEDARHFNDENLALLESIRNGEDISYREITWESHWNDSLLSLVTCKADLYSDTVFYSVINYDFALGRTVTTDELFSRTGTDREEYTKALQKAASAEMEENMIMMTERAEGENLTDQLRDFFDLRAQTLYTWNVSDSRTQPFLGEGGELYALIPIGIPAGAGWYTAPLKPDFTTGEVTKTVTCDFVTAELKENQVNVTFSNTGMAGMFVRDWSVAFDYPYPVSGLYGNYTDIAVGFMGNGGDIYLFLTDDHGLVTYCNITACMNCCAGNLMASGPLPFPRNTKEFRSCGDEDGYSVSAILEDGTEQDLYEYVYQAEQAVCMPLNGSIWEMEESVAGITVEAGTGAINWHTSEEDVGTGWMFYLGTTDWGQHFAFYIPTDRDMASGYLTLSYNFDSPQNYYQLLLTQCGGDQLPGMIHEDIAELYPVWF